MHAIGPIQLRAALDDATQGTVAVLCGHTDPLTRAAVLVLTGGRAPSTSERAVWVRTGRASLRVELDPVTPMRTNASLVVTPRARLVAGRVGRLAAQRLAAALPRSAERLAHVGTRSGASTAPLPHAARPDARSPRRSR